MCEVNALIVGDEDSNATADVAHAAGVPAPLGSQRGDAGASPVDRSATNPRQVRQRESNVGQALRTVYQQTVNEDVPDEMLKLLGKLT